MVDSGRDKKARQGADKGMDMIEAGFAHCSSRVEGKRREKKSAAPQDPSQTQDTSGGPIEKRNARHFSEIGVLK